MHYVSSLMSLLFYWPLKSVKLLIQEQVALTIKCGAFLLSSLLNDFFFHIAHFHTRLKIAARDSDVKLGLVWYLNISSLETVIFTLYFSYKGTRNRSLYMTRWPCFFFFLNLQQIWMLLCKCKFSSIGEVDKSTKVLKGTSIITQGDILGARYGCDAIRIVTWHLSGNSSSRSTNHHIIWATRVEPRLPTQPGVNTLGFQWCLVISGVQCVA